MTRLLLALNLTLALAAPLAQAASPSAGTSAARTGKAAPAPGAIAWRGWSEQAFADAKAQKKYVLLDLGAVWCHWCHVMDATTYSDPRVAKLIREHFIALRVDQDAHPDLSRRYEAFGWPATIVMDADGNDIGKMRGYREADRFLHTLEAILKDPSPLFTPTDEDRERVFTGAGRLEAATRAEIESRFREAIDLEAGGLKQNHRYIGRDTLEYGLTLAGRGDLQAAQWSRLTLTNARRLIDPVWGGMYQYSTHGDWQHPHYEKIMEIQASAIGLYARAYKAGGDAGDLAAAQAIRGYVKAFLTHPDGAFYTSQDADHVPGEQGDDYFALGDAQRRARGVPRVDTHVYTRENGWMIEALVELYGATGDATVLAEAQRAARWIVARRGNADGGFRRDGRDAGGPYFGDNLAMARAMLALYSATGERVWLDRARGVRATFARYKASNGGGYLSAPARAGSKLKDRPHLDENLDAARFANLLWRYTGDTKDQAAAEVALRYVADAEVALRLGVLPGVLMAADEAAGEPLHITVVGPRQDPRSMALHQAALRQGGASAFRRVEWWDPAQGRLMNPDVQYPSLPQPAAFVCTDRTCSLPLLKAEDLARHLAQERELAKR